LLALTFESLDRARNFIFDMHYLVQVRISS